jgi:membrane protein required for beta-lactamase induction
MSAAAVLVVIVALFVGCVLGWHANRARAAHGDLRTTKNRLPGFRRTRTRSGTTALLLIVIMLLVIFALAHH